MLLKGSEVITVSIYLDDHIALLWEGEPHYAVSFWPVSSFKKHFLPFLAHGNVSGAFAFSLPHP